MKAKLFCLLDQAGIGLEILQLIGGSDLAVITYFATAWFSR